MVKLNMKLLALWFFYSLMRLQSLCLKVIVVFLSACQNPSLEGMLELKITNNWRVWIDVLWIESQVQNRPPPSGLNSVCRAMEDLLQTLCV